MLIGHNTSSEYVKGLLGYNSSDAAADAMFGKYGTKEDFKAAIAELTSILSDKKVSTDPNVVQTHGFSANVSGRLPPCVFPLWADVPWVSRITPQ